MLRSNIKNSPNVIQSYPSPPPRLFTSRSTFSSIASEESQGASPEAILGASVPHELNSVAQWAKGTRRTRSGSEVEEPGQRPETELSAETSPQNLWTGEENGLIFMDPDTERPQPEVVGLNGYLDHYADARGAYIGIGGEGRMRQAWPRIRNRFSLDALRRDIEELKFDPVHFAYPQHYAPTSGVPALAGPHNHGPSQDANHTRSNRVPIRQAASGQNKAGPGSGLGIFTQSPTKQSTKNTGQKKTTLKKGKQPGDDEQDQESHVRGGGSPPNQISTKGYECILSTHDVQTYVLCLTGRFRYVSDVIDHLKLRHGFISESLCLVEPQGMDPQNRNLQRGLCKVCWDVFDDVGDLKRHVEEHERSVKEDNKQPSADRSTRSHLKFTIMQLLFAFRQPISDIRDEHSIPFQKLPKPGTSKRPNQGPNAADGPATKRPANSRSVSSASMLAQSYGQSTTASSLDTPTESWTSVSQSSNNKVEANVHHPFSPGTIDPRLLERNNEDTAVSESWAPVSDRDDQASDDISNVQQGDRLFHVPGPLIKADGTLLLPEGQDLVFRNLRVVNQTRSGNVEFRYDDVKEL